MTGRSLQTATTHNRELCIRVLKSQHPRRWAVFRGSGRSRHFADFQISGYLSFNVEVTGAAQLYFAASVWTAGLGSGSNKRCLHKPTKAKERSLGKILVVTDAWVDVSVEILTTKFVQDIQVQRCNVRCLFPEIPCI